MLTAQVWHVCIMLTCKCVCMMMDCGLGDDDEEEQQQHPNVMQGGHAAWDTHFLGLWGGRQGTNANDQTPPKDKGAWHIAAGRQQLAGGRA